MNNQFYGRERADADPVNEKYAAIRNPRDLYDRLRHIWCADTCAPRLRDEWSPENRTLGQCSITAFLAQDIFGGKVYGVLRPGGNYHCYNAVGDSVFDLTSEQFGDEKLSYENNPEQFREVHFAKEEKRLRYEHLKSVLDKSLEAEARFTFRILRPDEIEQAIALEQACFPPNEAAIPQVMRKRLKRAINCCLVAVDQETGKLAGMINGIGTNRDAFSDDFFKDPALHEPDGKNIIIAGVAVLPDFRMQGLARAMMAHYVCMAEETGRSEVILTCLKEKVPMYARFGYTDLGEADSAWGGEAWHEMRIRIGQD